MKYEEIEPYLPILKRLAGKAAYAYHRVLIIDKDDLIQEGLLTLIARESKDNDNEKIITKILRSSIGAYVEREANEQGVAIYSVGKVLWLLSHYQDLMLDYGAQGISYENKDGSSGDIDPTDKLVELIDIKHSLEQLPLDYQQVLILTCFENKSQREIAEEMDISATHVGRLYRKALRALYLKLHGISGE